MRKHLLSLIIALFTTCVALAQVTTTSMTGTIKDSKGATLPGATIIATHVPTGSVYSTSTRATGQFTIPNMKAGGPYTIKISFIGFETKIDNDVVLSLGQPLRYDVTLLETGKTLSEVTVKGVKKGSVISPERTGASTNISLAEIQNLPTVSRNVQDYARLTPQATPNSSSSDGSPLGISFAGQSNKYNSFTIDGAAANDVFGLSATGTNGGQSATNPIPLESIQELQVLLSPYDITQSNFTGGGINAVTKSGTNTFHGSVYGFTQNENFIGKSVTTNLKYQTYKNQTWGASLGGAIVKNKLFFFANYEHVKSTTPLAFDPTQANSGSKFDPNVLQDLHDYVLNTYKFDVGGWGAINKTIGSEDVFGRLDWNINDKNKLTVRHNYSIGHNDVISRTATTMTFANSGYVINNKTNSSVAELNTSFSSNLSNVARLTYTDTQDFRTTAAFPSVFLSDASSGTGLNYNLGAESSSPRNRLSQKEFSVTDNLTLYKDNHTFTFGTDNFFYNTNNIFVQYYYGYYNRYNSIAAFKANTAAPSGYSAYYSTAGGDDLAPSIIHAAQLSLYGQDVWTATPNFKLTYGVRFDIPVYFNKPAENAAFNASDVAQANHVATNVLPKSHIMIAPRVGFNWDVNGDASTQLRGGVGLFTGRIPFVYLSNQYGATGATLVRYTATGTALTPIRFNYNPNDAHLGATLGAANAPGEIDVTDRNFKFTKTLRANLAVDRKLGIWGLVGTLEGIYTKKINDVLWKNLNLTSNPAGTVAIGGTTRPYYNYTRVNNSYTDVLMLTNTSQGYAYNLTAQIQKPISNGWSGSVAYTYGHSTSLTDGTSSTAISNWRFVNNINGLNNPDVATANFDPASRIIGYVSKRFTYAHNRLSTTIGLVYSGQSGVPFSYLYGLNVTGDDVTGKTNAANLIYIPATAAEANFVSFTNSAGVVTSAAQQWTDFQDYLNDHPYLKDNQGKNSKRNADRLPWENHIDLKIDQDIYLVNKHKLSISADVMNIGNLINQKYGRSYYLANQGGNLFGVVSQTATPTFTFDKSKLNTVDGKLQLYGYNDYLSRFRAQLSLKYSF
jgi:hypothetical protein